MTRYAQNTKVPISRSINEIRRTLDRYGATSFMFGNEGDDHILAFEANGRKVKLEIRGNDGSWHKTRWPREQRRRFRVLLMMIKVKLELIQGEMSTFDTEFMPFIMLPDGRVVGESVIPEIEAVYASGDAEAFLPGRAMRALPAPIESEGE